MKFDHRFTLREAGPSYRVYRTEGVTARVDFLEHMLRVAILRDEIPLLPTWSVCPEGEMPLAGRDKLSTQGLKPLCPPVEEDADCLRFRLEDLDFRLELRNFRLSVRGERGSVYADREGLACNLGGELGRGSVHYTKRFPDQQIYGLGDKGGPVNKNGRRWVLGATDSMGYRGASSDPLYKQIPFYLCRHAGGSYGLYYDSYSKGSLDFGAEHDNYFEPYNVLRLEEENLVYYLILGSPAEIIRRFNGLCGPMTELPAWAFRYTGSTMEYTDAPDADRRLRDFAERCRAEEIPAGGFWMSSGYTQIGERRCVFHWNREKIPSPEGLAEFYRSRGLGLIANVKPAFLTEHPLYDSIAARGWFLRYPDGSPARFPFWGGMASYLDFTNPGAYAFWKQCVRRELAERGYCHIWNDNNEYDVQDESVLAEGFGKPLPACRILPLFSYLMARASREACLEAGEKLPFNVTRCGIAGSQRVAATWTGDNYTDFTELRWNHKQNMSMALTGYGFFGPDIGGFAGPMPSRELFLRWLQYGVFLPRFTLHSWKPGSPSTMPWLYPELLPQVRRLFALREKLAPYLYERYQRCRVSGDPLIAPVFLRQPDYDEESDCFLCGEKLLVCPVFDAGAEALKLTLPNSEGGWRLRGEGSPIPGGSALELPCLPTDLPLWFEEA